MVDIRLYDNFKKKLNAVIEGALHVTHINRISIFSKLDAVSRFHQLLWRKMLAYFIMLFGWYLKKIFFSILIMPEIFCKRMSELFEHMEGIEVIDYKEHAWA